MHTISNYMRRNLVAYLALFVALTGTSAYAANTVFSADIVNGEVKTPDLAAAAVTAKKLGPNAVSSAKVLDNSLTGDDIESLGQADLGANSVAASEFDTVVERRDPTPPVVEDGGDPEDGNYSFRTSTVTCDTGEQLIGGGAEWGGEQDTDELFIREMKRVTLFGATGWEVTGGSDSVSQVALVAVAYCLDNS